MMSKEMLDKFYVQDKKSMQDIAHIQGCSLHTVRYWLVRYGIHSRSISEAVYVKNNPNGDPFTFRAPSSPAEAELYEIGIGLYWGEGTKANRDSVRLGNTDPKLIAAFVNFLVTFFGVSKKDFRFGLQIFSDVDSNEALDFWVKELRIKPSQFYRPVVTISGSIGNYRRKSRYGVLTAMYHNKRLRDLLMSKLAVVAQW